MRAPARLQGTLFFLAVLFLFPAISQTGLERERIDLENELALHKVHGEDISMSERKSPYTSSTWAPSHVPDDVVLQGNDTSTVWTNQTDPGQVSLSSSNGRSWCIAKSYATPDAVQAALDWACGNGGADCGPVQLGNPCFIPNTVYSHASYAFNSYYQIHQHASGTCDFGGVATVTYEDPSYPGCTYPFRAGQVGASVNAEGRVQAVLHQACLATSLLLYVL